MKVTLPLTPSVFYILLALGVKERHGYGIMKQVKDDSNGKVSMGPGTLYGSIKRMIKDGLIEEAFQRPDPEIDDERRRYYRLTKLGRKNLSVELMRYEEAIELARKRKLIPALGALRLAL